MWTSVACSRPMVVVQSLKSIPLLQNHGSTVPPNRIRWHWEMQPAADAISHIEWPCTNWSSPLDRRDRRKCVVWNRLSWMSIAWHSDARFWAVRMQHSFRKCEVWLWDLCSLSHDTWAYRRLRTKWIYVIDIGCLLCLSSWENLPCDRMCSWDDRDEKTPIVRIWLVSIVQSVLCVDKKRKEGKNKMSPWSLQCVKCCKFWTTRYLIIVSGSHA